jgi:hypothetical protein
MADLRAAAQQALEALDSIDVSYRSPNGSPLEVSFDEGKCDAAVAALRKALAQQEPTPGQQMSECPHGIPHRWPCERCDTQQEQEPVATAWIHDGVMVNAFPWPPGDPRGCDGDQYWQGKGYAASPLYTRPPRREWQSLSEEEIADAQDAAAIQFRKSRHGVRGQQLMPSDSPDWWLARAIEAKLKEKNQ